MSASPVTLVSSFLKHRHLIVQMIRRDVIGRYRGSMLGVCWSFLSPLLFLAIYGIVFSVIFKTRWPQAGNAMADHKGAFAVILFSGLILHGFFLECITRATTIILHNANFVKKVVFPLEILIFNIIGSAGFHFLVSFALLVLSALLVFGSIPWTVIMLPLVLLPFVLMAAGLAWFLASLGTYIRDISQIMGFVATLLLFMSPVFFPLDAMPALMRAVVYCNPLTVIVEACRDVVLWGKMPNFSALAVYSAVSVVVFYGGFWWFQKTRKGFADVL